MEIEQHVAHVLLLVEGHLEGNLEGLYCEFLRYFSRRLQDLRVVDEPWRTHQHERQLLANALRLVLLHFEESWTYWGATIIYSPFGF